MLLVLVVFTLLKEELLLLLLLLVLVLVLEVEVEAEAEAEVVEVASLAVFIIGVLITCSSILATFIGMSLFSSFLLSFLFSLFSSLFSLFLYSTTPVEYGSTSGAFSI